MNNSLTILFKYEHTVDALRLNDICEVRLIDATKHRIKGVAPIQLFSSLEDLSLLEEELFDEALEVYILEYSDSTPVLKRNPDIDELEFTKNLRSLTIAILDALS